MRLLYTWLFLYKFEILTFIKESTIVWFILKFLDSYFIQMTKWTSGIVFCNSRNLYFISNYYICTVYETDSSWNSDWWETSIREEQITVLKALIYPGWQCFFGIAWRMHLCIYSSRWDGPERIWHPGYRQGIRRCLLLI